MVKIVQVTFEDAHRLALALIQLGQSFLSNDGIPIDLRKRVWSFIEGDLGTNKFTSNNK